MPVHDALLALLPLVGVWEGGGAGVSPIDGHEFRFGQRIEVTHDGRPFMAWTARAWLLDGTGALLRPAWRETGFWRPGAGADDVELVLAAATGLALVLTGTAGDQQWDLATAAVTSAPTAVDVDGERRIYAVRGDELLYATELAPAGRPFAAHLNGRLARVPAS